MNLSKFKQLRAAIGIILLATSTLSAANFVVNTTLDAGPGSLRQAMLDANANGGGNILFPGLTGTIHLTASLPTITANVNIMGPGTNLLTVSGNNQYLMFSAGAGTTNIFANFVIADGYALGHSTSVGHGIGWIAFPGCAISNAGSMTLMNCTISNCVNNGGGSRFSGGAICSVGPLVVQNCLFINSGSFGYNSGVYGGCIYSGTTLTINNCVFTNCRASAGEAICYGGMAVLKNCLMTGLSADDKEGNGGAIITGGSLLMESCTISGCWGGWEGGAIVGGGITARNCTIANCSGGAEGGALFIGGSNYFENCTLTGCLSGQYGGGVLKNFGSTTFVNCTLANSSSQIGGAIFNLSQLNMTNCTLSGNYVTDSRSRSAAILNSTNNPYAKSAVSNATMQLTACTIVSNVSKGIYFYGGGIRSDDGTAWVGNCIIANNTSNDFVGTLTSQGYNLIRNITNCTFAGDLTGNITNADPLLGPLQNNGGPTMTHALLAGSPAIDTGFTSGALGVDQRGVSRPQGAADDIGAFEFGAVPPPLMLAVAPTANGCVHVNFTGVPGYNYLVQRAASPAGPWAPLSSMSPGGDGCGDCMDVNPPAGSAFYRVVTQ